MYMTLQEVARELRLKESTIYKNFRRTQEALAKKGVILTHWGKDQYMIEYEEFEEEESFLDRRDRERKGE